MKRNRGGYTGDRKFVIKFRVDEGSNVMLRQLAEKNEWTLARVVRALVEHALSHGFPTTSIDASTGKREGLRGGRPLDFCRGFRTRSRAVDG